jgi:hypothetical protein
MSIVVLLFGLLFEVLYLLVFEFQFHCRKIVHIHSFTYITMDNNNNKDPKKRTGSLLDFVDTKKPKLDILSASTKSANSAVAGVTQSNNTSTFSN